MEVYILDQNFDYVAPVDGYISFIWTERYDEYSDFELKVPIEHPRASSLRINRYLHLKGSRKLMIIRTIDKSFHHEEGEVYDISGMSMESLLMDRVLYPNSQGEDGEYEWSGQRGALATTLVRNRMELGNKQSPRDAISNFTTINPGAPSSQYTLSTKPKDLYTVVRDMCREEGLGFRVQFYPSSKQLEFRVIGGVDRTESLVFSPKYDTLYNIRHHEDLANYKNVAYVFHKDRGLGTTIVYRPGSGSVTGISRRVLFVDASSLDNPTVNELRRWGRDALMEESVKAHSIMDGEIVHEGLVYDVDYRLGDRVVLEDTDRRQVVRLTEHIKSHDAEGYHEYPTFTAVD